MKSSETILSSEELQRIADLMHEEIKDSDETVIYRYSVLHNDSVIFSGGKTDSRNISSSSNANQERTRRGVYTEAPLCLSPDNFKEAGVARELQPKRFSLCHKGIDLPKDEELFEEQIPAGIDMYDDELKRFSAEHKNADVGRHLSVEQKIIVNSDGGKAIQTIPLFGLTYHQGLMPLPVSRSINAVCTSEEDIKRFTKLIRQLPDPTPDRKMRGAGTFNDAFHELYSLSHLNYGSLEEAGIPLAALYDVVILDGTPVHEIFGHHFEEPINFLNFGQTGVFRQGHIFTNLGESKELIITDNPQQEVEGFRVQGFTNVDAYGRKREPRVHLKNGEVVGFLGSEYADPDKLSEYLGLEKSDFVGNASQYIDGAFPQPRMSCTVLDGKIEDIDLEGRIVLVPIGGGTIPDIKGYEVSSYECYVVRDGVPKRVAPLQVSGGINQALVNMHLLEDTSYGTDMCGKPDPITGRRARNPASEFARYQLWEGQQVYPLPISTDHLKVLKD